MPRLSVEQAATNFTKAMVDLVGAVKMNGVAVPTVAPIARGRPRLPTLDDCKVVAEQVKEKKGVDAAVAIINAYGAAKLKDLEKAKFPAFIAACQLALNAEEEEEEGAGGDDSL